MLYAIGHGHGLHIFGLCSGVYNACLTIVHHVFPISEKMPWMSIKLLIQNKSYCNTPLHRISFAWLQV